MSTALISGATSGLGRVFINAVLKRYPETDELILLALEEDLLVELKEKYASVRVASIAINMGNPDEFEKVKTVLEEEKPDIRLVINAAGISRIEPFAESDIQKQLAVVDINDKGTMMVTKTCLPYMKEGSEIILIGSGSGYAPNPNQLVYSATKAFVIHFSVGLREELKKRGINVMVVNPGRMKTGMGHMPGPEHFSWFHNLLSASDINMVAEHSLKESAMGRWIFTPGVFYKIARIGTMWLPRNIAAKLNTM